VCGVAKHGGSSDYRQKKADARLTKSRTIFLFQIQIQTERTNCGFDTNIVRKIIQRCYEPKFVTG